MKNPSIVLFSLRLFFYLGVISLVFIHPGIAVSFDKIGIMQWFVIIPAMALTAFFPVSEKNMRRKLILTLLILSALSVIAGGFGAGAFVPFLAGLISFSFTFLLFHHSGRRFFAQWAKLASVEPFFLAWICLRLLNLSRSGEDVAGQSMVLTQFIFVWTAVVFLLHSAVIYLCLYPKSYAKSWKEGLIFLSAAFVVLLLVLVVLPPDFVRNAVINNLLSERIPQRINPSETDRGITQRGGGRRTLPRGENGSPGLRGISEHNWSGSGGDSGENRQYMIKIVASETEPVYMGNVFRGQLDPVEGFMLSPQEQMNDLANQRFFVTWFSNEREPDIRRERIPVFSLSTLRQKYLPYRPVVIDPTILNEDSGPLRYIHQVESNMHSGDPLLLVRVTPRNFNNRERTALAHYLELPLEPDDLKIFTDYLNNALDSWQKNRREIIQEDRYLKEIFSANQSRENPNEITVRNDYMEKIIALLVSFSRFQYNLNPNDNHSIASLKHFILESAEGDCVEFSNTLALLGRIAGIPSRVVTGYIAAEGLQTHAHLRGLAALRARIPALQQFPFDNLYMVTNIHSHSWTQFFIPAYGWLDFESTSFSLPPQGMGDFNNWDVVIPILDEDRTFSQVRKFPWQAVIRFILILKVITIVSAYALRYVRELILRLGAQKQDRKGARSLYLLLLAKLAADGQPIKPASKTAHEYSDLFKINIKIKNLTANQHELTQISFKTFADLYSEIRWREFNDTSELEERFKLLRNEYDNILSTRKRGIIHGIKRLFSLRGLAYL